MKNTGICLMIENRSLQSEARFSALNLVTSGMRSAGLKLPPNELTLSNDEVQSNSPFP